MLHILFIGLAKLELFIVSLIYIIYILDLNIHKTNQWNSSLNSKHEFAILTGFSFCLWIF